MPKPNDPPITNAQTRQALNAIREVVGVKGLDKLLRLAELEQFIDNLPPDDSRPAIKSSDFARLNQVIETSGSRSGRRLLILIGTVSFQNSLQDQGLLMYLAGKALQMLPQKQRILFVLESMANALRKANPEVDVWVEETAGKIAYVDRTCPICVNRQSQEPICDLSAGTIAEAVRWATGNSNVEVRETECIAKRDAYCRFVVTA
jgi:predicted hydrocarbon binding protein